MLGSQPAQAVVSPQYIAQCTQNLYSNDPQVALKATQQFRRILSIGESRSIRIVFAYLTVRRDPLYRKKSSYSTCN